MPHIAVGGRSRESSAPRRVVAEEWVEVAGDSGDQDYPPCAKILHKKAKRVKFNGTKIIFCELTNGDKASGDGGRVEDVAEMEIVGRECGGAGGMNREAPMSRYHSLEGAVLLKPWLL